jgi:hypothetical protein
MRFRHRSLPLLALLSFSAIAAVAAQPSETPPATKEVMLAAAPPTVDSVVTIEQRDVPKFTFTMIESVTAHAQIDRRDHRSPQRAPLSMQVVALGAIAGSVRAKVRCSSKTKNEGFDGTAFRFDAVYSSDPSSENKSFTDATPSLSLNMTISDGKPAADQFEEGKEYYLDFTPAE